MWIERRSDVVDIFPDRAALVRLVGAVLAEQQDVWTEMRRYIGLGILAKSRQAKITDPYPTVISMTAIDPAMATAIVSGRRRQAVTRPQDQPTWSPVQNTDPLIAKFPSQGPISK